MPVETAESPQREELLPRNHAEPVEHRVEPWDVVALRGEEDVALGVLPADRRRVQPLVEQVHDEVEGTERRAQVPGPRPLDRDEGVQAAHVGEQREPRVLLDLSVAHAVELALRDQVQLEHVGPDATALRPWRRRLACG
jgi:hypothetical protein